MLPGAEWHRTLLKRHEVRGQLASWHPSLTSGVPCVFFVPLLLGPRDWGELHMSKVSITEIHRWADSQGGSHLLWLVTLFLLSGCDPQQGWPGLAWVFLWSLRGLACKLGLYCREMEGSGTCCGLSLAQRQSYQLRLNMGSLLLWITFAATPVCLSAPRCIKRPLLLVGRVHSSIYTMDPNEAKRESCMR